MSDLPFVAKFFPLAPIAAMVLVSIVIVGQGMSIFVNDDKGMWGMVFEFISTYIGFFSFIILYLAYKYVKKN